MTERDDEADQSAGGDRGRHRQSEPADSGDEAPSYEEHFPLLTHANRARPTPTPYPRRSSHRRPSGTPPPAARPVPSPRKRSGGRTAGRVVVALLSALALIGTGYGYATLDTLQDNVHTTDALNQGDHAPPADDGAMDILLVGTDARTDMQGNALPLDVLKELRTEDKPGVSTDTLIVLRIPHNGDKPTGVSIPRDAWVTAQGGNDKISSVFGSAKRKATADLRKQGEDDPAQTARESDQEGRKALVKAVQNFTQVRIDHYAEVNLLGFYLLTEALGGVEVCLNNDTQDKDSGADFKAGPQVVSGGEALSFVRQRKNLPRGDLDRIVRQQAFLGSALHKVLSAGTLTSPAMLNRLTDAVRRSLVLDPNLDLLKFAEQARGIASGDVAFVTIPVRTTSGHSPDGQSIVEVDPQAVHQFIAGLAGRAGPQQKATGGGASTAGFNQRAMPVASEGITASGVTCVN